MTDQNERLAAILAKDSELRAQQQSEQRRREEQQAAARKSWLENVQREYVPGLKPVLTALKDAGWQASLDTTPAGFRFTAYRGDMRVYGGGHAHPNLLFEIQERSDYISVTEATPTGVGSVIMGGNDLTARNASLERVKELVTDFIDHLALKK